MQGLEDNTGTLVSLMYSEILGRPADESGFRVIVDTIKDRKSLIRVVKNFLGSDEASKRHLTTAAVAGLYGAFVNRHPEDARIGSALRELLRDYSGKVHLVPLGDAPRVSSSNHELGSIWLSDRNDAIEGWLVLDGTPDTLSIDVRIKDREPWTETLEVENGVVLLRIALPVTLTEHSHVSFDATRSVISIESNAIFREQLFFEDYIASTKPDSDTDPFGYFMDEGIARGTKFNPFCIPRLKQLREAGALEIMRIDDLNDAFFLTGLVDAEYCAARAGVPADKVVRHASGCVMRDEWVDFHPLVVRHDFERHDGFGTMLEWVERLSDPSTSLSGLEFDRFSPDYYRRTCDRMLYENELIDYIFNDESHGGEPHPFCNTRYAAAHLPDAFAWPRRGIWADSFCAPESYRIPFSPFWDPSAPEHDIADIADAKGAKGAAADPHETPLDAYLHRARGPVPSPLVVPSALVHTFLRRPLGECRPDDLEGRDVVRALEAALVSRSEAVANPRLTVCILDYGKAGLSIVSAIAAACTSRHAVEVLVLDNGSHPADFALIAEYTRNLGNVRTVRSARNLYFGEGNNVLADRGTADLLLFLNNDAFVGPTMIDELIDHLDATPGAAAVGPTFLFPDLRVQEASGTISNCGRQVQLHKGTSIEKHLAFMPPEPVEGVQYISAACFCIRRSVIGEIGGFDPIYEPFYFEDIDLCKRMEGAGHRLDYLPRSFVIHYENASTRDFLSDGLSAQIERSRATFQERWLYSRPGFRPRSVIAEMRDPPDPARGRAVVYTPFDLSPGRADRDRYILSCAVALSTRYDVSFCSDGPISRTRLSFMISDAGIESPGRGSIRPCLLEEVADWGAVDVMIAMGDEIVPPVPLRARVNLLHCPHPLPVHLSERFETNRLDALDAYLVDSDFTRRRVERDQGRFGRAIPVLDTGLPVAAHAAPARAVPAEDGVLGLLCTGPFEPSGLSARQDIAIEILGRFHRTDPVAALSLVGAIDGIQRRQIHADRLKNMAGDLPVTFHTDASAAIRAEALDRADVFLHACGYNADVCSIPDRLEHSGMATLRAMAAGAIPLVYDRGVPAEIVERTGVGHVFGTLSEAVRALQEIAGAGPEERAERAAAARAAAARHSDDAFREELLGRIDALAAKAG